MRGRAARRLAATLGAAAALVLAAGCASIRTLARSYDVADDGLQRDDHDLRAALDGGAFDSALVRVRSPERSAPRDRLLRDLYGGLVAYYAGRFDESAHDLDHASLLAEERYTKSVARGAAALASNDMALEYMPGRTERLLVHYYAMLGYLRRDSTDAAAVEARRMSKLLEQYAEGRDSAEVPLHGTLHYLAGAAFEAAGQRADADVSYRNATLLLGAPPAPAVDTARRRPTVTAARGARGRRAALAPVAPPVPTGDVLVVVEWGFVTHRVQRDIAVAVDSGEVVALAMGGRRHGRGAEGALERALRQIERMDDRDRDRRREDDDDRDWDRDGGRRGRGLDLSGSEYLLHVAWPALERAAYAPPAPSGVLAAGVPAAVPLRARGDVSDAAAVDFRRTRAAVATRALTRAAVKYAATRYARKKGGDVAELMVNVTGVATERADTRSWQLLPAHVGVTRLTLPPGTHRLVLPVDAMAGGVDAGEVTVEPGRLRVATVRLWRGGVPVQAPAAASAPGGPADTNATSATSATNGVPSTAAPGR